MWLLGQGDDAAAAGGILALLGGMYCLFVIVGLVLFVVGVIGAWKVFEKAGKPGWAAIVPIYNAIVLMEIVGRPIWWFVLLFIPCVQWVIAIIVGLDLAKSFGRGPGFGIGLALLGFIFFPILGFGKAQYVGPAAAESAPKPM